MTEQKEIQEKLALYQLLQNRLGELRQQVSLLEKRFMEIEMTRNALEDVGKLKKDSEILVPLGSGCYARGKLTDTENLLVDLGAGAVTHKETKPAQEMMDKKKEEIEKLIQEIHKETVNTVNKMNELGAQLQQSMAQAQQGSEPAGGG